MGRAAKQAAALNPPWRQGKANVPALPLFFFFVAFVAFCCGAAAKTLEKF